MIRKLSIAVLLATVSGCASLKPPPAMPILDASRDPQFAAVFRQMTELQREYRVRADELLGEAGVQDTLSLTAQVATLGFATFEAHPDNIAAAAIVTGVTGATRDRLGARETAQFYLHGATALSCVADYANTLTYVAPGERIATVSDEAVRAQSLPATSFTYVTLQLALRRYLADAAEIAQPSPALKAAISEAQNADQHLSVGIEAQANALAEIVTAKNAIHSAVENRQIPNLKALLEDITKIKIPAPPTAASTGSGTSSTKANKMLLESDNSGLAAFLEKQDTDDKRLSGLLNALSLIIKSIRPEKDAETISKIKLCVVGFAPPKAAS